MRYQAPATGVAIGAIVGVVQKSDSNAGRYYCAFKERAPYVAGAAMALGAASYLVASDKVDPDISFGAMISGAVFLGQRTGRYIVEPKDVCPGSGCHSTAKAGCTTTPWVAAWQVPTSMDEISPMGSLPRAQLKSPSGVLAYQRRSPGGVLA